MKLIFACTSKSPTSWFKHFGDQGCLQGDTIITAGMIKHSQSTQSNKFAISLQYLKKEVKKGAHFLHADGQSFY